MLSATITSSIPSRYADFYSLGAFFADIDEPILGGAKRHPGDDSGTGAAVGALDAARAEAAKAFDAIVPQLDAAQRQWEADVVAYGVILPELRPESQAADPAKQAAQKVADILKVAERNPEQQKAVQDYFRNTVTQAIRGGARQPGQGRGSPGRVRRLAAAAALSVPVLPTKASSGFCLAVTGWMKAARS